MKRPLAISLSPNAEKDDVLLAVRVLFNPKIWFDRRTVNKLERMFSRFAGRGHEAVAINSGRSALYVILQALKVSKDDEIIIQPFTCVSVPNSIIWLGAKPVYVDIDETLNLDANELEKSITERTRAIVVQHTFGVPANLEDIIKVAKKHKIIVIEDCAHSLGATFKGKLIGTQGDISFYSFGRDKVISSVFGGMILTKSKSLHSKVRKIVNDLPEVSRLWLVRQLLHPIIFFIVLPLYDLVIGKVILVSMQKLRILDKAVYQEEKEAKQPKVFPAKMPGGLAVIAVQQMKKLNRFNNKRKDIAGYYIRKFKSLNFSMLKSAKGAIWLRFPIFTQRAEELIKFAQKNKIILGNWYKDVITPVADLEEVGYLLGSCSKAEKYAEEVINLPTYPTMTEDDQDRIVNLLESWQKSR